MQSQWDRIEEAIALGVSQKCNNVNLSHAGKPEEGSTLLSNFNKLISLTKNLMERNEGHTNKGHLIP